MAYEPLNVSAGDPILAEHINEMSAQVAANETNIASSNAKYSLIENFTLTEDAVVMRNVEPNSTPYNFKRLRIEFAIPATTPNATNYICINSPASFSWYTNVAQLSMGASAYYSYTEIDCSYGYINGYTGETNANANANVTISQVSYNMRNTSVNGITAIRSEKAFPAGTNIKIYGVRA